MRVNNYVRTDRVNRREQLKMNLNPDRLLIDADKLSRRLQGFIKTSISDFNRDGIVVGLSGGLDSAVVLGLSVAAVGPDKVTGLIMPERDSQPDSEYDARLQADELGVDVAKVELTPFHYQGSRIITEDTVCGVVEIT